MPGPRASGLDSLRASWRALGGRGWGWLFGLALLSASLLGAAALSGYWSGQALAGQEREAGVDHATREQFDLGVADLLEGRPELARQRFEYILSLDPDYPGAAELLAEALAALNAPTRTPYPTDVPSSPTPTLDVRSLDGLMGQAQSAFAAGDWSGALRALLALRARDPAFRTAEVNTLMAASLRNRGVERIIQGARELGMYDLALAERFGPLDAQALSWRNSAAFYQHANSYIGLDWERASTLFSQLCASGGWDSCRKYALAAMHYGDLLMGTPDPCAAIVQYQASLNTFANPALEPTAAHAASACQTATAQPPTPTPSETPTPTLEGAGETPTGPPAEPTATPTPTETPTPGG